MKRASLTRAAVAAALCAVFCSAAAAPLGRLFATPAERAELDSKRGAAPAGPAMDPAAPAPDAAAGAATPAETTAAPAPPEALVLNGVLRRSNGKSTIWLNDIAQPDQRQARTRAGTAEQALTVTLPSGKKVRLRPGQRYDLARQRVMDVNEP